MDSMTQLQQSWPVAVELPRQLSRCDSLRNASQDDQQLGTGAAGSLKDRVREHIEDATADPATIVHHRPTVAPVNRQPLCPMAAGAANAAGMENVCQLPVTRFLVHKIDDREIHNRSSLNRAATRRLPYRRYLPIGKTTN
jgi:hypothetical protein